MQRFLKEGNVTSPDKYFDFKLGTDRKMARWDKIVEYFKLLEKESSKIKVVNMGPSTEGNPFLLVIISSPKNLKNLDRLMKINAKISDPRKLKEGEVDKLINEGKAVICQSMSLHASEIGGTQMAATLDVISRGRLEFGIGAGWNREEHETYGYGDFPKPRVRIERLRESLEIIKRMWTEDKPSFRGKYYYITDVTCEPKPLQKPHPPILVGGGGEKYTLKVVAAYADRWNFGVPPDEYVRKSNILRKYCAQIGRDFEEIEKSFGTACPTAIFHDEKELMQALKKMYKTDYRSQGTSFENWATSARSRYLLGTPETCLKKIRDYMDLGVTHFIKSIDPSTEKGDIRLFAKEVMSKIQKQI